jgi:hypothetical protein
MIRPSSERSLGEYQNIFVNTAPPSSFCRVRSSSLYGTFAEDENEALLCQRGSSNGSGRGEGGKTRLSALLRNAVHYFVNTAPLSSPLRSSEPNQDTRVERSRRTMHFQLPTSNCDGNSIKLLYSAYGTRWPRFINNNHISRLRLDPHPNPSDPLRRIGPHNISSHLQMHLRPR